VTVDDRRAVNDGGNRRRVVLFVLVGGIAAGVNIVSRIVFSLAVPYEVAIVLAYGCGMTTAYVLNRMLVFMPSGRRVSHEYLRFALVNLVAAAQVWIVSVALARFAFPWVGFAWHAETVAHVIGIVVPAFTSYFGHKHFSFAATLPPADRADK
jgi:putative flippase GtrA